MIKICRIHANRYTHSTVLRVTRAASMRSGHCQQRGICHARSFRNVQASPAPRCNNSHPTTSASASSLVSAASMVITRDMLPALDSAPCGRGEEEERGGCAARSATLRRHHQSGSEARRGGHEALTASSAPRSARRRRAQTRLLRHFAAGGLSRTGLFALTRATRWWLGRSFVGSV